MPSFDHLVRSAIKQTARVRQVEGMFDIESATTSEHRWRVDLPIEEKPWKIGLIVGPSGCGKSTIARKVWGDKLDPVRWSCSGSVVDEFAKSLPIKQITGMLSRVGFSSPPSWLKPYDVLSNGEKFRCDVARAILESDGVCVIDEWTSVVDRTVAQIGSAAVSKAIRDMQGKQLVCVTCHEDVVDWLQPDWVYRPGLNEFRWRLLQRRPQLRLEVERVSTKYWEIFKHHHYLSHTISTASTCFVASLDGKPVAFTSWINHLGAKIRGKQSMRGHRTVCLPDYQGLGIGNALSDHVASAYAALGMNVYSVTTHPHMIHHRNQSKNWKCTRIPSFGQVDGKGVGRLNNSRRSVQQLVQSRSVDRLTASFLWVGESMQIDKAKDLLQK